MYKLGLGRIDEESDRHISTWTSISTMKIPFTNFCLPQTECYEFETGTQVLPGLYVGNFRDAKDEEQLRSNDITHIVSIHDNAREVYEDKEYLCIQASDSPGQNLTQFFSQCNDFIHSARVKGGKVLIHCLAGVSRSVTIVVAYIMSITSLSCRDALKVVRNAREVANPNVGFQKQLSQFEYHRLNEERRRIRESYPDLDFDDDEAECQKVLVTYHNSPRPREACICRRYLQPPPSPSRHAQRSRSQSPSSPVRSRSPHPPVSPARSQYSQTPPPSPTRSPMRSRSLNEPPSPVHSRLRMERSSSVRSESLHMPTSPVRSRSPHAPSSPMHTPSPQSLSSPVHSSSPLIAPSPVHSDTSRLNTPQPPDSPRRRLRYPFMGLFRSS